MKRLLSALVGVPLVVAAVYLPDRRGFSVIAAVIFFLALREYLRLCGITGVMAAVSFVAGTAGVLAAARWAAYPTAFPGGLVLILVAASLLVGGDPQERFRTAAAAVLGTVYIAYAFGCLVMLRLLPQGPSLAMTVLIVLWAGDTAAYYGGRKFGRRKLAPVLSPKKTLEGSALGLAGSAVAGVAAAALLLDGVSASQALAVSLAVAVSGQAGDLVVSLWKRAEGVKDSGAIIPGHGGLLDRIDSLLLGLPSGYLLIRAMGF